MRILWIEDAGSSLQQADVAMAIFSKIIPMDLFDSEYDKDAGIGEELPRLFAKHARHEIVLCRSFVDWRDTYEQDTDFDLILVDINLEAYKTPVKERPFDDDNFDKRAGLFIYQYLIRSGFPENHIAFFTGEGVTLKGFARDGAAILMERPSNTFEKKPNDLVAVSNWLEKMAADAYLCLRRGVIDGCKQILFELNHTPDVELYEKLYGFTDRKGENPELLRNRFAEKIGRLKTFLPLRRVGYGSGELYHFLVELCQGWEMVEVSKYDLNYWCQSQLERYFVESCFQNLSLLKDLIECQMIPINVKESFAGFCFLTALRSWFRSSYTQTFQFESNLIHLFPGMDWMEFELETKENLEKYINASCRELHKLLKSPNMDRQYLDLVLQYCIEMRTNLQERKKSQDQMPNHLLRAFINGLCPSYTEEPDSIKDEFMYDTYSLVQEKVDNCAHLMIRMIYKSAFGIN